MLWRNVRSALETHLVTAGYRNEFCLADRTMGFGMSSPSTLRSPASPTSHILVRKNAKQETGFFF